MNDSSWGAPTGAGYWGPPDQGPSQGASPAGPAYEQHAVEETRPMPIVPEMPEVPAGGRDQDDDRGAARPSGPLFRDESQGGSGHEDPREGQHEPQHQTQHEPQQTQDQTHRPTQHQTPYVTPHEAQHESRQEPMPSAAQPAPAPPKKSAGRDLGAAIGVGVGLGAVIVASLFIVKAVFVGVVAVAVVVGLWELTSRLEERKGIKAPLVPLAIGGAAMVVAGYVRGTEGAWVAMALTALAVLVWRMTEPPEGYLRDVTAGVFAAFYVPFLATFVALMLTADDGPQRVLTFLLLTVVSDTGAYAIGWRFGKHKLAPRISPGKTREGLVGAVTFAMAAGALCMQFLIDGGAWWQGLLLGLAVAASATLGDLGESMIKRDLGIKDMGTLLPGHGGIMDRLDSLLPTAPVVWLLLVIFVGAG
ncbi:MULTISPECIES: phosphatidate cytidylyltransferase [unclassified Streptomyces]|uniref:phosphatidate cytidylyltransferase n=1 Tax=unclassified Streptomyces TaxID=2593676 RepID=UPI002DDAD8AD|nr:phosphatidate cytidylyltransferase [Streptomyces sp. NBC_01445]WSE04852.1 phosphatidate cytidylyltransferase [Streptomyces sp. NBC_01445]